MRLTVYSDYSLRLLMYAALQPGRLVTIREVAEAYGISRNHLMKVAFELGRDGLIETVRGRKGGFRLARPPEAINLGHVVRLSEDDFTLVECFDKAANACAITRACRLRHILSRALDAYFAVLDKHTLADLTDDHPALSRMLAPA